jgi:16S rRNA (adenine1518-N6/adenine1519-N6)-dimethyltransferase
MNQKEIKNLLRKYNLHPSKRLGQNFLIDKSVLRKIVEAAELSKEDIILEVGPGIGNLTMELAKKAKKIIAVEKDLKMIEILKETMRNLINVEIVQGNILDPKIFSYIRKKFVFRSQYKLVANIPYYLTSPLIRKFLEEKSPPKEMILMVQKEVARRICAKPPDMNLLAVSVQFYAKPEIVSFVSKNSFWPKPKVDSAIIKIKPLIDADRGPINADLFFKVVKAGFSHPRKQLINNLSEKLKMKKEKVKNWLLENNIQPSQRAENLTIKDWINLIRNFKIE